MIAVEPIPPVTRSTTGPHVLEDAGGYVYRRVETLAGLDLEELSALVGRAWGHDYRQRSVVRFDAPYLRWLLGSGRWFSVEVRDDSGQLVGVEVALERGLRWDRRPILGYYVTVLTVDPAHRGRGLARGILRHLTAEALDRRQADVIVSTFDVGAAGQPTVERSVADPGGDLTLHLSPPLAIWACTPDLREVDRYEPLEGPTRAALWPGVRQWLEFHPGVEDPGLTVRPSTLVEADATLRGGRGTGFDPTGDPADRYAHRGDGLSGTLRFGDGGHDAVHVAWHVATLTRPGLPDRWIGTVQFVVHDRTRPDDLSRALRHVNRLLLRQGCLSTIIVDTGMIPRSVLWRSGFRPTPRRVRFAVRGRSARFPILRDFAGPYCFDLL